MYVQALRQAKRYASTHGCTDSVEMCIAGSGRVSRSSSVKVQAVVATPTSSRSPASTGSVSLPQQNHAPLLGFAKMENLHIASNHNTICEFAALVSSIKA
jgi:hypothetical protein